MKVKINKGDTVEVISGDDKGHRGEVQHVIRKKNKDGTYDPNRVLCDGGWRQPGHSSTSARPAAWARRRAVSRRKPRSTSAM